MRSRSDLTLILIIILAFTAIPAVHAGETYQFVRSWGSSGNLNGQFHHANDIAVDTAGNVYVADYMNNRIQKFTPDGIYMTKWGTYGDGDGQFNWSGGVAVDRFGYVYVADTNNHRIQKFSSDGAFLGKWGSKGSGPGQFSQPSALATDSSGNVYVCDINNHRIQKFRPDGTYITEWGRSGDNDGQFVGPNGIAIDASDNVYVIDWNGGKSHGIQKFDADGRFIKKYVSYGTGPGQFYSLTGIDVDAAGNIYVIDYGGYRIEKFSPDWTFVTSWGSGFQGTGDGEFGFATGLAADAKGSVYVIENTINERVQKFAPVAAPPAPRPASLVITSVPAGADIYVDGVVKGSTPATLTVDAGTYAVAVKKEGFRTYLSQVAVGSGQTIPVIADLQSDAISGTVTVTSSPSGADVFIDDMAVGKTPVTARETAPGVHLVRLSMPGFKDEQKIVDVPDGAITVPFILTPVRQKGEIIVYSTPSSADVLVDGKYEGITPSRIMLDAGDHTLLVVRDDKSKEVPISVSAGEIKDVTVDLPGFKAVLGICAVILVLVVTGKKRR